MSSAAEQWAEERWPESGDRPATVVVRAMQRAAAVEAFNAGFAVARESVPVAVEEVAEALWDVEHPMVEDAFGTLPWTWAQIVEGRKQNPDPDYPHLWDEYMGRAERLIARLTRKPTETEEQE